MCGIAGRVQASAEDPVSEALVAAMCAAMAHRGPDDQGLHAEPGACLGMRRLKVIDLEGGHQPMANEDGTLWLVFNGEIYNYLELRRQLAAAGHCLRTHTDTEVILHLYEDEGVGCLRHLRGMFALALFDTRSRCLFLARDRLGKKPLYYAQTSGGLAFASELSALMVDRSIDRQINLEAVDQYLSCLFVPQPLSIYRAVSKLPSGCWALYQDGQLRLERYWRLPVGPLRRDPPAQLAEELDDLLQEAVSLRLLADVPLGAFLSGGLDSSLVVALMQRARTAPVRTYSIGFREAAFSELPQARQLAAWLGTEHHEEVVDYQVRDLVPKLAYHFGEPFADSSAIPMYHLSRVARRGVTVALSGDGGDEVFGGYRRYQAGLLAQWYNQWPRACGRSAFERLLRSVPEPDTYYGRSWRKKSRRFVEFARMVEERPHTSWDFFFDAAAKRSLYSEEFADTWGRTGTVDPVALLGSWTLSVPGQEMLWTDLATYLPEDILAKVDRMSMACSLETRAPLLDHRVVEFAATVPRAPKYNLFQTKRLLRRVAGRYLPPAVLRRPKQGFAIPLAGWLRRELRPWMEDSLRSRACRERGWFRHDHVEAMMAEHACGRRDLSQQLWALLMLETWLETDR
jgi:asparagine synthase (glutamine-hydrolysing)